MAKVNYPEELTNLLSEFLTDGIISTKERIVLLDKAEKLGIDRDEFDLYIDAQQQKVDQSLESAAMKRRGSLCPYCGKPVPQLAEQCPHCGQYLSAEASQELQEILDKLEDALLDFKSGKDTQKSKAKAEKYIRKARMYYSNHPKVQLILAEIDSEIARVESNTKKMAATNAILKYTIFNKWFWAIGTFVLGAILQLIFPSAHSKFNEAGVSLCWIGAIATIFVAITSIIKKNR